MLLTVNEFRDRASRDVERLITDLQFVTGRYGDEESAAWKESLPKLATVLAAPSLQKMHLYCRNRGNLSLEYQLPACGSWADVVLLGSHRDVPAAIIIELKNWRTRADRAGRAEGLIEHLGKQELHPSDQVRGYVEYCRRFHSAVQDAKADVHGLVLFTKDFVTQPYVSEPNSRLTARYPVFTLSEEDVGGRLPEFLADKLSEPAEKFAWAFEQGNYRQERGFIRQIATQIRNAKSSAFELLDNQRLAFSLCNEVADEVIRGWKKGRSKRRVVCVIGPPGSGKSAVAARLWAEISLKSDVPDGDLTFVTTSLSQNSNWGHLFESVGPEGARGVIRKATAFHPISTHQVGQLRKHHGEDFLGDVKRWRENLRRLRDLGQAEQASAQELQNLVSIVDEAHSLINTEREGGVGQFGFAPTLGPQAYHIMRCSLLSIFLLDPAQGFRHRENTSLEDLKTWAGELGAEEVIEVNLSGVQFRCAGSVEYVTWLEALLDGAPSERCEVLATAWRGEKQSLRSRSDSGRVPLAAEPSVPYLVASNPAMPESGRTSLDFRVFEDPITLEAALRDVVNLGNSARLLSTYSRKWVTRDHENPHNLPPSMRDFCERLAGGGGITWSRIWNVVPLRTEDYSYFVQGVPGSALACDPLCEVGCPFAVRGFDYDYVGVLWLEDLIWRNGRWTIDLDYVHETGISQLVRSARKEGANGEVGAVILKKVQQAYRILLTRALKGVFVWAKDPETRAHLQASLRSRR